MIDVNHKPEVDFELDTFTVVVLRAGARAATLDEAEVKGLLDESSTRSDSRTPAISSPPGPFRTQEMAKH